MWEGRLPGSHPVHPVPVGTVVRGRQGRLVDLGLVPAMLKDTAGPMGAQLAPWYNIASRSTIEYRAPSLRFSIEALPPPGTVPGLT